MKLRPGLPEEVGMSAARMRHVATLAESWVQQGVTPALVVLVARRGVIVLHEAWGRLTPAADAPPLARDTIYPLASISKPITATAAMILVEEGRLGLNRPVAEYIPEFVGTGKEAVLVHHLLTHTSGLREEDVHARMEQKRDPIAIPPVARTQHPRIDESLFYVCDTPLWKPPGTEMSYCTYGYRLLGEVVRRVSGQPLADFAQARIFEALGMHDTHYGLPAVARSRTVKRPPHPLFAWLDSQELQETPWADTGVFATALDLAIFAQTFLNHGAYDQARILSPAGVAVMTRNQIPGLSAQMVSGISEFFPEASWGYGWDVHGEKKAMYDGTLHSPYTFQHAGWGGVNLWIDPAYELVGVYLSVVLQNTADGHPHVWPADLFMNAVTAAIIDG